MGGQVHAGAAPGWAGSRQCRASVDRRYDSGRGLLAVDSGELVAKG
jgi:hypothetical protein